MNNSAVHIPSRAIILPNLTLPAEEETDYIEVWEQRRLNYLKHHRKVLYYNLLTSGKLHSHIADTEEQAQQLFLRLVNELAEKENVTEQLKATDQMKWVQKMNNIRSKTTEIVNAEITFV
ncbi:TnpV protein [uncultured Eubacterium sp.]|uniref:TnpV protein n=1 Tax=uncultured Eubacterium sp. TaxID=165185 RepID=UPI00345DD16B